MFRWDGMGSDSLGGVLFGMVRKMWGNEIMKGFWIRSWHGIAWEFWRKSWGFSLVEYITVFRFLGGKEIEGTPRLEERLYDHRMG